MDERARKILLLTLLILTCLGAAGLAITRPRLLSNQTYLLALIFLQVLLLAVWKFRQLFFLLLILSFVGAGTSLPMKSAWTSARWGVLAVGAAVGFLVFMKGRSHHFHVLHLLGLVCAGSAFVSVMVSVYPGVSFLKAVSLCLLFAYAASGGRTAIVGREASFLRGLLLACEIIVYGTAVSYLLVGHAVWGNPNSLGLVMGMVSVPLLFWGVLVSETQALQRRRGMALALAVVLLLMSRSRASILAAAVASTLLCLALRRYRLLFKGAALAVCVVALAGVVAPQSLTEFTAESTSELLYKGHKESGILGSRESPWQQTMDVINQHPWFGSGFGTSSTRQSDNVGARFASNTEINREHGNSYLALLEWVGVLGVVPFVVLLFLIAIKIGNVLAWMRRTASPFHPAVPVVIVMCAALVHAGFEDWLFAVGNYTCVFFWTLAFALPDLTPAKASPLSAVTQPWHPNPVPSPEFGVAPGR
jgi:O-antigen ligase